MTKKRFLAFAALLAVGAVGCGRRETPGPPLPSSRVKVGAQVLIDSRPELVQGKRLGVITNHSALLTDGTHLLDKLRAIPGVTVAALFGPEHGFSGTAYDGAPVGDGWDDKTKTKVYSLYGGTNKPTPEMLDGIDLLVFDIQDVGVRFYTFTSTMFLCLEAAAERKIPFLVLDRPNPTTGLKVEGPLLEPAQKSFVGLYSLPVSPGMTVGELAGLVNGEGWLAGGVQAELQVVKMDGWTRDLWFVECGIPWVKPSPNMVYPDTAVVYPGTCFLEGTNVSEGRGTENPFAVIGAPYIDGGELAGAMNALGFAGVEFQPLSFYPMSIPGVVANPKYEYTMCGGVFLRVSDRNAFRPVRTGLALLSTLKKLYPKEFEWRSPSRSTGKYYIDLLTGTPKIRELVDAGAGPDALAAVAEAGLADFLAIRQKYLLY
jgi:uncharacterized protein YbbC (DUF1343 family)